MSRSLKETRALLSTGAREKLRQANRILVGQQRSFFGRFDDQTEGSGRSGSRPDAFRRNERRPIRQEQEASRSGQLEEEKPTLWRI
jgi:hypothetical protein